jgi:hypothetical protein
MKSKMRTKVCQNTEFGKNFDTERPSKIYCERLECVKSRKKQKRSGYKMKATAT